MPYETGRRSRGKSDLWREFSNKMAVEVLEKRIDQNDKGKEVYHMNTTIYAVANQKGGCGKSSSVLNLGAALARKGYRVLLCDLDPQANLTMALGYQQPDELPITMPTLFGEIIAHRTTPGEPPLIASRNYILHAHGADFIPSSIELADMENVLINTMSRENVLKRLLGYVKADYDVILIDCAPSLNFITVNALTAADKVLIPLQPQFFSAKGLEMLLRTISDVRRELNPSLGIEGALINMYDGRLNFHNKVIQIVTDTYGGAFKIFETKIPISVRMTETQSQGASIFDYDPRGKIAESYGRFADELILSGAISGAIAKSEIGGDLNG